MGILPAVGCWNCCAKKTKAANGVSFPSDPAAQRWEIKQCFSCLVRIDFIFSLHMTFLKETTQLPVLFSAVL